MKGDNAICTQTKTEGAIGLILRRFYYYFHLFIICRRLHLSFVDVFAQNTWPRCIVGLGRVSMNSRILTFLSFFFCGPLILFQYLCRVYVGLCRLPLYISLFKFSVRYLFFFLLSSCSFVSFDYFPPIALSNKIRMQSCVTCNHSNLRGVFCAKLKRMFVLCFHTTFFFPVLLKKGDRIIMRICND